MEKIAILVDIIFLLTILVDIIFSSSRGRDKERG